MQDRRRGDISGPERGDFVDWDNPEDLEDDTPEGYYDDEEDDGSYIPGANDPDYDLSEAAGYAGYQPPPRRAGVFPQWVIVAVSLLLIVVILTPVILRLS